MIKKKKEKKKKSKLRIKKKKRKIKAQNNYVQALRILPRMWADLARRVEEINMKLKLKS